MNIEKTRTQEIVRLHSEVVGHLRQSLEKAIRIGLLLSEQKQLLKHGEFTPWLEANIPFTDRTARNYMRLYRERDRIKTETVSDLKGAYAFLANREEEWNPDEWRDRIREINTTFFPNGSEYQIDDEPGSLYRLLKEKDDGSMIEREKIGFCLQMNFAMHFCYWTNFERVKGKDSLPSPIRRYFDEVFEDRPTVKICHKKCGCGF